MTIVNAEPVDKRKLSQTIQEHVRALDGLIAAAYTCGLHIEFQAHGRNITLDPDWFAPGALQTPNFRVRVFEEI
jgi:hypothetical protein